MKKNFTASDWESKINAPLVAAKDAGSIDEYSYAKFQRCFEKKSLSDCKTEPGLENMLTDYPMTAYTDIYVLKTPASTVQLNWITTMLTEYAGFTAETPQMLLQNLLSPCELHRLPYLYPGRLAARPRLLRTSS